MPKSVNFTINLNVNGKNIIAEASTKSKELAVSLGIAEEKGNKLREALINFNQVTTSFQNVAQSLQQLTGMMHTYTEAYTVQQQAETQLTTAMRNTMGATDAQIQSIKDLTAAQQALGVVGDEVQLAGAKELATHIKQANTLRTLIPLMNDMAVAQDGVNVSSSTTSSIASLLGKAMEGNVNALKRMGISFTEAQVKIMQAGTEEQRAAILTDVLSARFGGMNQALANTAAGGLKQAENAFGDMQEKIGSVFIKIEPFIKKVSELGLAFVALGQTASAVKSLTTAIKGMSMAFGKIAIAITVLTTLVAIIRQLSSASSEAAEKTKELASAERAQKQAAEESNKVRAEASSLLDIHKAKLSGLIKAKEEGKDVSLEEKKVVAELNSTYGETMGYFSSVSAWYKALTANSETYCEQMVIEAETRRLANQIAEKEAQKHDILYDSKGNKKKYSKTREYKREEVGIQSYHMGMSGGTRPTSQEVVGSSPWEKANKQVADINGDLASLRGQLKTSVDRAGKLSYAIHGSPTAPVSPTGGGRPGKTTGKTTGKNGSTEEVYAIGELGWYDKQISELNKKRLHLSDPDDIRNLDEQIQKLKDAKMYLERMSEFTKEERAQFDALMASGTTAVSQVGGGPLVLDRTKMLKDLGLFEMAWGSQIDEQHKLLSSLGFSWDDVDKKAKEYFATLKEQDAADALQRGQDIIEKQKAKFQAATDSVNQLGGSLSSLGSALKAPELNVAGTLAQAIATMTQGYAQASAQATEIGGPWGWIAFAATGLAQLAAMISSVKNMNTFAEGGIAYGPTVGLFGEYAGAKHNPEVVAPLDRLRQLMPQAGGPVDVRVRIKERDLYGVSQKSNRYRRRMG